MHDGGCLSHSKRDGIRLVSCILSGLNQVVPGATLIDIWKYAGYLLPWCLPVGTPSAEGSMQLPKGAATMAIAVAMAAETVSAELLCL